MIKNSIVIIVFLSIITVLVSGCGSSSPAVVNSSPAAAATSPSVSPSQKAESLTTEVVYFHLTQRCVTCLCFESRIKFVIDSFYKDAIDSGKMTFNILNAQEKQNANMAKKYKAVGSQLFINTISNSVDHIKDIQEIWDWKCNNDPDGFNQKVRDVIDQSLKGQF